MGDPLDKYYKAVRDAHHWTKRAFDYSDVQARAGWPVNSIATRQLLADALSQLTIALRRAARPPATVPDVGAPSTAVKRGERDEDPGPPQDLPSNWLFEIAAETAEDAGEWLRLSLKWHRSGAWIRACSHCQEACERAFEEYTDVI